MMPMMLLLLLLLKRSIPVTLRASSAAAPWTVSAQVLWQLLIQLASLPALLLQAPGKHLPTAQANRLAAARAAKTLQGQLQQQQHQKWPQPARQRHYPASTTRRTASRQFSHRIWQHLSVGHPVAVEAVAREAAASSGTAAVESWQCWAPVQLLHMLRCWQVHSRAWHVEDDVLYAVRRGVYAWRRAPLGRPSQLWLGQEICQTSCSQAA